MTNTPPPTSNNDDDAVKPVEPETPVFDEVATDHPELQDAAPTLVEPSTEQAAPASEPVPLVEPATPEPVSGSSLSTPDPVSGSSLSRPDPVSGSSLSRPVEPAETHTQEAHTDTAEAAGYDEHIDEPALAEEQPAPVAAPAPSATQTVYVTAPVAPKAKGNRGFGLLFAFLALLVFAVLFVGVTAIVLYATFGGDMVDRMLGFFTQPEFIVPLAVFIVAFAILVLLTNRAGWWSYVFGSFLVALAVYFGSIGVILLTANVLGMTADVASDAFWRLAASPYLIIAGILAREVTIWFGAAIARRGRKVKERNLEARAAYERELDNQPLGFS
jgi:hypothetical protein